MTGCQEMISDWLSRDDHCDWLSRDDQSDWLSRDDQSDCLSRDVTFSMSMSS